CVYVGGYSEGTQAFFLYVRGGSCVPPSEKTIFYIVLNYFRYWLELNEFSPKIFVSDSSWTLVPFLYWKVSETPFVCSVDRPYIALVIIRFFIATKFNNINRCPCFNFTQAVRSDNLR